MKYWSWGVGQWCMAIKEKCLSMIWPTNQGIQLWDDVKYYKTYQFSTLWNCKQVESIQVSSITHIFMTGTINCTGLIPLPHPYLLAEWRSWRRSHWGLFWWLSSLCRGPCASVSSWLFSTWRSCPLSTQLCNCGETRGGGSRRKQGQYPNILNVKSKWHLGFILGI